MTGGGGSLQTVNAVAPSSNATFSFDAATDTYTIQDTSSGQTISASFGAADKTATSAYAAAYSKTAAGVTDTLTLYGNARAGTTGTAPILLSYTSFGLWTQSNGGQVATTFFVFGQPTLAANVPLSGTASYQTFVAARKLEMNFVPLSDTNITGTATFSADFGSGKVSTMLSLIGKTFDGAGTISGNAFSGGLNDGATLNVGQFIGGFYGPAAQEMGYGFRISLHNPDPFAGAAPAPGDTYLTGVVVGAKQ